jgi:hypothetical protein
MMLRQPRARGPNSIRPWNQPHYLLGLDESDDLGSSSPSSAMFRKTAPAVLEEGPISSSENSRPEQRSALRVGDCAVRSRPSSWCQTKSAAPSAPPASPPPAGSRSARKGPRAGCAVADAVQRHPAGQAEIRHPVSRASAGQRSMISSVTTWIEAARSISRCVSSDSGGRGGAPKSGRSAARSWSGPGSS